MFWKFSKVREKREHYSKICTNKLKNVLTYEYFDIIVLTVLYVSTIFINKYVLSVLKFTFPTVFQGWQTLVGMIILKLLNIRKVVEVSAIDRSSALSLVPHGLFFVGSIVAGSKALAILPIPVFVSVSNLPIVCIYLLDCCTNALFTNLVALTAGVLSLLASISIIILDIRLPFADSGYSWLLAHVVFSTAQLLYSRISNPKFSDTDKLYYSNIFSVVILAPSSFYLDEAFSALNFQHRRQMRFYFGCLLSGILGVSLQLWTARIRSQKYFSNANSIAKIVACLLSTPLFALELTFTLWIFVLINLVTTVFIPRDVELSSSVHYAEMLDI